MRDIFLHRLRRLFGRLRCSTEYGPTVGSLLADVRAQTHFLESFCEHVKVLEQQGVMR